MNKCQKHEFVDLGLPSGTLWATCNVGAEKPEDCGNYYAWGEIKAKSTYLWDTYKYGKSVWALTKYCGKSDYGSSGFTDNLTTLEGSDDPASSWGSGWSMPLKEQWVELLENTTNKWTMKNGVSGYLFIARNSQTVFLPVPGDHYVYWSRSLVTTNPYYAWSLACDRAFSPFICSSDRYHGLSVRPVRHRRSVLSCFARLFQREL